MVCFGVVLLREDDFFFNDKGGLGTIGELWVSDLRFQRCIKPECGASFGIEESLFGCPNCGDLLDVLYEWDRMEVPKELSWFERRWGTRRNKLDFSGVWRFRELLGFCEDKYCTTVGEGQTILQQNEGIAEYVGRDKKCVYVQYEGLNPSGSFKDNGMAGAFSHARMVGAKHVI